MVQRLDSFVRTEVTRSPQILGSNPILADERCKQKRSVGAYAHRFLAASADVFAAYCVKVGYNRTVHSLFPKSIPKTHHDDPGPRK